MPTPDVKVAIWKMDEGLATMLHTTVKLPAKEKSIRLPLKRPVSLDELKPISKLVDEFIRAGEELAELRSAIEEHVSLRPEDGYAVETKALVIPAEAPPLHQVIHQSPAIRVSQPPSPDDVEWPSNRPLPIPKVVLANVPDSIRGRDVSITRDELETVLVTIPRLDATVQGRIVEKVRTVSEPKVILALSILEHLGKISVTRLHATKHLIKRIDTPPADSLKSITNGDVLRLIRKEA